MPQTIIIPYEQLHDRAKAIVDRVMALPEKERNQQVKVIEQLHELRARRLLVHQNAPSEWHEKVDASTGVPIVHEGTVHVLPQTKDELATTYGNRPKNPVFLGKRFNQY